MKFILFLSNTKCKKQTNKEINFYVNIFIVAPPVNG